jgi:hypothetical protein
VWWRRRHEHQQQQPRARVVGHAVRRPGGGDDGLARLQRLLGGADREASAALEDDVDLVLVVVGVDPLRLAAKCTRGVALSVILAILSAEKRAWSRRRIFTAR